MSTMKKLLIGVAGLAMLTAPIAASAHPMNQGGGWNQRADNGRGFQRGDDGRDGGGAAVAAGIFGFFLATAIVNADHAQSYDQGGYAQNCGWQTQAYNAGYGRVAYRQVEVCT